MEKKELINREFIQSETNDGVFYKIETFKTITKECSCDGFKYKKTCKHIKVW